MSTRLADERMRRVIGIASTGWPIYAISGSEGDNDGSEDENDKAKEKEGTGDTGGTGGDGGQGTPQPRVFSEEEYSTILRRLEAADKAKGEMEKRLRAIDDADKSELEKAKRDLEEIRQKAEKAEAAALQARLANEILKFPGFVWHDPEAILKLVDMEKISVDPETDKVTGVKDALQALAKDKPYLLKGKQDSGKDGKSGGSGGNSGASGHNPAGAGDTTDKNKRRDQLVSKYKLR